MFLPTEQGNARSVIFDLSQTKPSKTLDIGLNGTLVSADSLGRILQLSTFHAEHGIVLASPYEQFDGSKFHDPSYVREYRAHMLNSIRTGEPGFGLRLGGEVQRVSICNQSSRHAVFQYMIQVDLHVTVVLYLQDDGELVQSCTISSTGPKAKSVQYTLDAGISINRASYGQLTEGGPIPIPKSENDLQILDQGRAFAITNPHLGAHVHACLEIDGKVIRLDRDIQNSTTSGKPVVCSSSRLLEIPPGTSRNLTARFRLRPHATIGLNFQTLKPLSSDSGRLWRHTSSDAIFIIRRNLEYILGNCAIPISAGNVCLITDHVALPLGWNRDNYWQVRFLLDVHANLEKLVYAEAVDEYRGLIKQTVKGHLNWVFRVAQRPHNFWHRSYLVTGRPKDAAVYQLDQQCYPLLELCDFFHAFQGESAFCRGLLEEDTISQIIDVIESKRDSNTGLHTTDETPGDDVVEYPFHFSSHILLWYTLSRLGELMRKTGETSKLKLSRIEALAHDTRVSTLRYFRCDQSPSNKPVFAYLVDGQGQRTFYHDANDIPTLFAPEWGFLTSTDELEAWRNTMDFAFSPANYGGFYAEGSRFGGLGSVHTRGPWPLGYLQEFVYAQLTEKLSTEEKSWRKITGAMLWDGLFSEAVDSETAECTSKAWFSWPGSMIGSALLRTGIRQKYLAGI